MGRAVTRGQSRLLPRVKAEPDSEHKKLLRSGKTVEPVQQISKYALLREKRAKEQERQRRAIFPFLMLPAELRLIIYGYLFFASNTQQRTNISRYSLRAKPTTTLQAGRVIVRKLGDDCQTRLHSKSAIPHDQILATCKQIRNEAQPELYRYNVSEMEARRPSTAEEPLIKIPSPYQLTSIRQLVLITNTIVSTTHSLYTYRVLSAMPHLQTISIAMKNTSIGDGPDFHSCMEFLNFNIWLSHKVQLDFEALHQLTHHDHPTWVSTPTLDMYRDLLTEARGIALGRWTYETGAVYERGLDVAKCFRIL